MNLLIKEKAGMIRELKWGLINIKGVDIKEAQILTYLTKEIIQEID